jgi:hypothetical protein
MERHELEELHYIAPICNISSILRHGILSHDRAQRVGHESVAMPEMQDRRSRVRVPQGRKLHEYANLYLCGRNPILYKRLDRRREICVVSVSTDVLDLSGTVITDRNAGGDYVRFRPAPDGLAIVDRQLTFADYWMSLDPIDYWRRKAAKCAEVLVPDRVEPRFVRGIYVSCDEAKSQVEMFDTSVPVQVNRHLFFG